MPAEFRFDSLALTFQSLPKLLFLSFAAGTKPFVGHPRRQFGTFFKLWQQLFDIKNGNVQQSAVNRLTRASGTLQCGLQPLERSCLCLLGVGFERSIASRRLHPAGGHGDQYLMQTLGLPPEQAQPSQQNHPRDGIGGLHEAGAGQSW